MIEDIGKVVKIDGDKVYVMEVMQDNAASGN